MQRRSVYAISIRVETIKYVVDVFNVFILMIKAINSKKRTENVGKNTA